MLSTIHYLQISRNNEHCRRISTIVEIVTECHQIHLSRGRHATTVLGLIKLQLVNPCHCKSAPVIKRAALARSRGINLKLNATSPCLPEKRYAARTPATGERAPVIRFRCETNVAVRAVPRPILLTPLRARGGGRRIAPPRAA